MNNIRRIIENVYNEHRLISVYCSIWEDNCYRFGFVDSFDDKFFVLSTVNEYGKLEGLITIDNQCVEEYVVDSIFLRGIEFIIQNRIYFNELIEHRIEVHEYFLNTLIMLKDTKKYATLIVQDKLEYIGYILDCNEILVEMQIIDCDNGQPNGMVIIRQMSIVSIIYGGPIEEKSKYLHEYFNV